MRFLAPLMTAVLAMTLAACGGGDAEPAPALPQSAAADMAPQSVNLNVSSTEAARQVFDFAERTFPAIFNSRPATQTSAPFHYRQYANGVLLGVVVTSGTMYQLNSIYVMGGQFGPSPVYVGPVTSVLPALAAPVTTNKTLVVTVNVMGQTQTVTVGNVPAPTATADFCAALAADTTMQQINTAIGGTLTINSCTFSGFTGSISATIASPQIGSVPFTMTYTYR